MKNINKLLSKSSECHPKEKESQSETAPDSDILSQSKDGEGNSTLGDLNDTLLGETEDDSMLEVFITPRSVSTPKHNDNLDDSAQGSGPEGLLDEIKLRPRNPRRPSKSNQDLKVPKMT